MRSIWRRKTTEQELSTAMAQYFQSLRESLNLGFDQLMHNHEKAAYATENVRKAIERDSNWMPIPADGLYQIPAGDEIHGTVFLPLTPEYDITLRITNRTYNMESVVSLVVSRKFMPTRASTLEDGHEVLIVSIDRDLAPRSFATALYTLLEPEEAGAWLEVQQAYQTESPSEQTDKQQVSIVAYPFRKDLSFDVETHAWRHDNELYFDRGQCFRNILPYPLAALTAISKDKME